MQRPRLRPAEQHHAVGRADLDLDQARQVGLEVPPGLPHQEGVAQVRGAGAHRFGDGRLDGADDVPPLVGGWRPEIDQDRRPLEDVDRAFVFGDHVVEPRQLGLLGAGSQVGLVLGVQPSPASLGEHLDRPTTAGPHELPRELLEPQPVTTGAAHGGGDGGVGDRHGQPDRAETGTRLGRQRCPRDDGVFGCVRVVAGRHAPQRQVGGVEQQARAEPEAVVTGQDVGLGHVDGRSQGGSQTPARGLRRCPRRHDLVEPAAKTLHRRQHGP